MIKLESTPITPIRVSKRADFLQALPDMDTSHTSERGLLSWGHDWFDAVIENHSGPADLEAEAVDFLASLDLIGQPAV